MEIFKLFGSIFVDTDTAEKSLQKIDKAAEKFGNSLVKVGEKAADWGGKLTKTITAGISALGTAAVVSGSSFEDAIAKASTIADESEMSIEDMRKAILGLSDQTGISAAAIAEDVYNAISAGQKTADAVNFVSNSTKLARAGFAETGQSLDVLTTIMNAYGMEAEDVTRVSDILIQTQNLGKTTVADLSSTMGKVIPTAKSYNVSLEQVASAYTITTAKGIATAESTTYINSMLNELGKSGTTVSNTLKEQTGKSFSELMLEGYSLGDCLAIVDQAAREQNLAFNDMWGSAEAAKAGVTLLGESAEVFNGRLKEMNNVSGSTDSAFEKLETTSFKAQKAINEAKNVLIDLGSTIIEMLLPYLEKGSQKVHEFADWFKSLDDNTKETIVKVGLLVAAVGPLLSIFGKGVSVVGNVIKAGSSLAGGITNIIKIGGGLASGASKLSGIFGGIASFILKTLIPAILSIGAPVGIVIAVIGGLVAAGVALYKNWDTICEWAGKAWNTVKNVIGGAVDAIGGFFSNLGKKTIELKDKVVDGIGALKDGAVNKFQELKEKAGEKFSSMKENVVSKITEMKDNAGKKITDMRDKIASGFQDMKEKAAAKFTDLKEKWSNKFSEAREKMVSEAEKMRDNVGEKLSKLKDNAVELLSGIAEKGIKGFESIREKGASAVSKLKDSVGSHFTEMGSAIFSKFEGIGDRIKSLFSGASDTVKGIVDKLKGFMNFDWKLPKIKLPHFDISWDTSGFLGTLASKIGLPGLPKLAVEWYKDGGIMMKPTAFGINPSSGKMMAGGEAGPEAIAPIELLKGYIQDAVRERDDRLADILNLILELLKDYLPQLSRRQLVLDTGQTVGALAEPMSDALYKISSNQRRSH